MIEPDDTDMLAAEYVLGTLGAAERADVTARLPVDARLAGAVEDWQARLAPLSEAVADVMPPDSVLEAILARLFGPVASLDVIAGPRDGVKTVPLRQLRRWQVATGGFGLLAASLLAWAVVRDSTASSETPRFTAVLQRDANSPAMVVDVDLKARRLMVRAVGSVSPADHAYELWIVDPAIGAPRSLGVVPQRSGAEASLRGIDPAVITEATYAITLEAPGGSPTGRPTSAPILTGKLVASSP